MPYYRWYSNKMRGRRAKQTHEEVKTIDVSAHEPRRIPSKKWRELIKKVWEATGCGARSAHGKCASFRSSTRRMSSSASCAISGSGKRGGACIAAPTRRRNDPRSVARRPLPRLRHRTGRVVLRQLKPSGSAQVRLSHPLFSGPQPSGGSAFDFRAYFCHSAPMETHAFGFRHRDNAPEGQKRFPISDLGAGRSGAVAANVSRSHVVSSKPHTLGEPVVDPTKLVTLFMIVTERDHLIADYAIRSFGKIYHADDPRAKSFVLHIYLNCLSDATRWRFRDPWFELPWVQGFANTERAAQRNLVQGERIVSPEGIPSVRDDANEKYDELWSSELLRFETKYVGTVDADFEVLAPDFFFAALDELEQDAEVAGCSTDHSATSVVFDGFSGRTIRMHERWHTWFCLYRRSALARSTVSHFQVPDPDAGRPASDLRLGCISAAPAHRTVRISLRLPTTPLSAVIHPLRGVLEAQADGSPPHPENSPCFPAGRQGLDLRREADRHRLVSLLNLVVRVIVRAAWRPGRMRWRKEKTAYDWGTYAPDVDPSGVSGPGDAPNSRAGH